MANSTTTSRGDEQVVCVDSRGSNSLSFPDDDDDDDVALTTGLEVIGIPCWGKKTTHDFETENNAKSQSARVSKSSARVIYLGNFEPLTKLDPNSSERARLT